MKQWIVFVYLFVIFIHCTISSKDKTESDVQLHYWSTSMIFLCYPLYHDGATATKMITSRFSL